MSPKNGSFELFIAIRHVLSRRRQTLLSVTAVALAVSISLIFTSLGNGTQELLVGIVEDKLPHVRISPAEGDKQIHLYRGLLDRVTAIEGVRSASASLSTEATISFKGKRKNALLRGVDPAEEDAIYKISGSMVSGDFYEIQDGKKVVIGTRLAERLGLKVGDRIDASFPRARGTDLRVVGIFDTGTPLDETVAYVSLRTAREFLDEGDVINSVELRLFDINEAERVAAAARALGYNAAPWQENNPEIVRSINVGGFWRSLSIFFVMIIAAFGIAAIMNMLVLEKVREMGMLLALGADRSHLLRIFIFEAGVLGLLGGLFGSVLGLAGILALGSFRFETIAGGQELSSIPLVIDPINFPVYVLLAVVLSLLAGAYPAYRASKLDPVEALKGAEGVGTGRKGWRPTFIEEILACRCISLGFETGVAARHIISNRRGTAFTLISVGVAVGVIIMSFGLTEGVRTEIVAGTIEKNPHLLIEPKEGEEYIHLYRTAAARISDHPGVVAVSPRLVGQGAARYRDNVEGVEFIGVDPGAEEPLLNVQASILVGEFSDLRYGRSSAFLGVKLAEALDIRPGESFDLVLKDRTVRLKVAGLVEKGTVKDSTLVYLPLRTAQDLVGEGDVVSEIGVRLSNFEDAPGAAEDLSLVLNLETSSWEEYSREIARFVATQSRINIIFYSMILAISAFVIANTTIMIVSRRTREIGIMMAMGAQRWSILRIFLLENLLLALPGGVLGSAVGLAAGRLIAAFGPAGFGDVPLTFTLSPALVVYSILFALCLNFLAGLYPAFRASKLDPVEAIA
ncbi:FtsX-like permease family protein [Candidatus Methanocrinis natronophilus]|uniref:ABC transporter permease n=1 Tax=Candidatus Methanocrinis natronophilus TaxID=3033396 RepID=A0ABT5XBB5_9EURY|nr:FtsX-like permease family protein [Candidatus Methanocrinis natronophilus]MDF0591951.1 ABC transporter permease [Candidatus Methanocrinis natronophilus]